jgi:SWI/SNF-related matrix-associated actin-dependent regulator of chromatin subfamily A3
VWRLCSIEDYIEKRACCAVCRYPLKYDQLIEGDPVSESASVADEDEVLERQKKEGVGMSAAKTAQLVEFLQATEVGVKSLVFSQVSSFLACFVGWPFRG